MTRSAVTQLDEESLKTYRGDAPKRMPITAIDPCLVAGFLLKNRTDLEEFVTFAHSLKDPSGHAMVAFLDGSARADIQMDDLDGESDFVDIS